MKIFNSKIHQTPNAKREPLYTLEEIAEKLGVEHKALMRHISGSSKVCPSPKPVFTPRSRTRMSMGLYRLSDYKAWWQIRQDFIKGESK